MILVTGANGILGSRICKELILKGFMVKALVREDSDLELLEPVINEIELIVGDILIPEEFEYHLTKISYIIHCAALVSFIRSERDIMDEINVQGTANMTNLALKYSVDYFIHISSVAAIGRKTVATVIDETNEWEDSKLNTSYANSKMLAEMEVRRSIEEGLNAVILNPSVIISPDNIERSSSQIFKYVLDERKFYPSGTINYVDIRDVVSAVIMCLNKKITGQRYILNANKISYKQFFSEIAKRLNKRHPTFEANSILLKVAMILDFLKSKLFNTKRAITAETVRIGQSDVLFKNEKANMELGINFAPLKTTLDWACQIINEKNH